MNSLSAEKVIDFNDWLGELFHPFRVVILAIMTLW